MASVYTSHSQQQDAHDGAGQGHGHGHAPHGAGHAPLAHHFHTLEQQYDASLMGMWVFLITELMLFGGLFLAYAVYRYVYPEAFLEASHHLNWLMGTINTVVLIVSSLMMALGVHAAQEGHQEDSLKFMALTIALGTVFLIIKGFEYNHHFEINLFPGPGFVFESPHEQQIELFYFLYFVMTGTHALHMIIGISLIAAMMYRTWRGAFSKAYHTPVELTGLYWHFVDVVWVFLFPLLYLIGRH